MKRSQNFMISKELILKEVETLAPLPQEDVLEIGSGHGELTLELARRANHVIALELDRDLVQQGPRTSPNNVSWIQADALKFELKTVSAVISNVPYHISSPLVFKLLLWGGFGRALLVLQKEFAERLVALPGSPNYGRLSVTFQLLSKAQLLFDVPPWAFSPKPKVWSSAVMVYPLNGDARALAPDLKTFTAIIFSQKNKMARGVLLRSGLLMPREDQEEPLSKMRLDTRRIRQLSPEEVLTLLTYVKNRHRLPQADEETGS